MSLSSFSSQSTSAGSKAAALIRMKSTSYNRMWLFKDNVFFSGPWRYIFDGVEEIMPSSADLVGLISKQGPDLN